MVQISRAIVHEIPKGKYSADGEHTVALSSAETTLAPETRRFIEENMLDFGLKSPRQIVEDPDAGSTTPTFIREILSDPDRFVDASQGIALNLHRAQTGNSPSGVLIVATVTDAGSSSVIILKAEHAEGMRLRRVGDEATGRFDLQHLNELIVGNNSRIYKIALLSEATGGVAGDMVDQQNGVAFADFFMSAFLGCRLADNSEVQTRQFMQSAMNWVNKSVPSESDQARYATALIAYMGSPATSFQATEFADQFLEAEVRDDFVRSLPDDVATSVVNKDLALVPGQGAGLRMYAPGVVVSASAVALERGDLEILSEEGQSTTIRIRGSLKRYGLGSAPKG
ncbi:nucleoid associated protein NdpA [Homoserinimonas aerilata]|uniref:Nucleoid associated protein NdpA n=1 Tax=Homoserinimonas aerilata TaxID=1162970 RepID=A0A542YAE0_9MICO|nr:nucleoid-associated protein [Homoserinimonas aerilata]TQL45045.1 nucleoid associated protein NdpA [Homoserinimonas aerilata]